MLIHTNQLIGADIYATDGEAGSIHQLYFEDDTWAVRYLVASTLGWLTGRELLVSPLAVTRVDWKARRMDVALSKKQFELSPDINTHLPVSRQHEAEFFNYYGYPYYWVGPSLWGETDYPFGAVAAANLEREPEFRVAGESPDSHLRSTESITGYAIEAKDGELGHLDGFVFDDATWLLRYIEVATHNWWPGKKILISTDWMERISWEESKIYVSLTRDAIQSAPEYFRDEPLTREYETQLFRHYGRAPYWLNPAGHDQPSHDQARNDRSVVLTPAE